MKPNQHIKYLLGIVLIIMALQLSAQTESDTLQTEEEIATIVETFPEYPGGRMEMNNYLLKNITYPKKAREVSGKVIVAFVVEKDGSIKNENITIEQSVHPLLDEEAIRLVRAMPKWKPAYFGGSPVRYKLKIPITFR